MKTVQSLRSSGFFCVAGRGLRGLVLMAASLGAVGAAAEETQPTRLTWTTYASEAMPALDLQATQLRLVMFRPDGGPAPDVPAGVFVNGRLLSSLLPGGFADAVVCRHSWRVQARTASQASALLEPTVPTERELFVRVQVQDDGLVLQPVTVPEFLAQSQSLRRQNHVVSRLAPVGDCQRGETRYTLASELLFQFGKHGIEDLLRMGEHEIVKLARKIREEHSLIEHVQVVGHTDPMGMTVFMFGLAMIVVGTGHFKPSVSVMVGQLYKEGDPRRDGAFSIFYMGINLGAFLCAFVCGTLGEKVGWHWGFGSAAVGMFLGLWQSLTYTAIDAAFYVVLYKLVCSALPQSSLAAVLLTATLAGSGMISLPVAIGLVIGANVGSGVLALLSSSMQSAAGRRVALGSLLYTLLGLLLVLPLVEPLVHWMSGLGWSAANLVITFHLAYNGLRCLLMLPSVGLMARLCSLLLPERVQDNGVAKPRHLDRAALDTPSLALANAVVYLALAPKSNAVYVAYKAARASARETGSQMPPRHILNAPTKLMKDIGYGSGYAYDHDAEDGFSGQDYFPEGMKRPVFYAPPERGFERELKKRVEYFAKLRAKRQG